MKKIQYCIYICDDELFFLDIKKDKIYKDKFKSMQEDAIINSSLFIDEFSKFLKKNHIKTTLFGENIGFIKTTRINSVVLEKYEEILKEYFHKIEYTNLEDVLKIDTDTGYLHITKNYIDYYFQKKGQNHSIRIDLEIFNGQLKKAIHHSITTIYKPKKMMVFGSPENLSKIAETIMQNYNIPTTFPEVYYHYIFEEYKR